MQFSPMAVMADFPRALSICKRLEMASAKVLPSEMQTSSLHEKVSQAGGALS